MRRLVIASIVCVLGSLVIGTEVAHAQWQPRGVIVSAAPDNQTETVAVADGNGGAIFAWFDTRNGTTSIYARKVDRYGVPQWTTDGVALCTAGNNQDWPQIASDGAGGAIVTWEDLRAGNYNVYARRVNAAGVPQWTPDGVPICTAANNQEIPQIMSDGAGGAFIVWPDFRNGTDYDLYAQRVNGAGTTLWASNGVAIAAAGAHQIQPALVSDGAGGFLVAFQDNRISGYNIYMQDVNASGVSLWTPNGIVVCSATGDQTKPQITTDGVGGAIVAWDDGRSSFVGDYYVYVQRVTSAGVPWWTTDGVQAGPADGSAPVIVADGVGGAFMAWQYSGTGEDIVAQRFNASGIRLWYQTGIDVCSAGGNQVTPRMAADGDGGVVIAWKDQRALNNDAYAQRVDGSGSVRWQSNGIAIAQGPGDQSDPIVISDAAGGSMIAWYDNQSGMGYDLIAQRIDNVFGFWGHPEPLITSVADVPADQGGKVKINWNASDQDRSMIRSITYYSVWRAADAASVSAASWVANPSAIDKEFHGTAAYHEKTPTIDYYWEWIGNQDAVFDKNYSFAAATRADSVAGHLSVHQFRVIAHTSDEFVLFKSLPVFGYSVDNLAPASPLLLTAQRVGADVHLKWNRAVAPDLRDYSIYRKTSSGVTPAPINFLASSNDTLAIDPNAPTSALYYIVTAYDVHANQSAPSNEVSVQAMTGIGNTPALTSLDVLDNMPNPFTSSSTLRIGLPKASDVEIDVFDVAGRRVRSEHTATLAAGWREIAFDARGTSGQALPSGVYFYRVKAAGETITRKMVITR